MLTPILFILGLAVGIGVGYVVRHLVISKRTATAERRAEELVHEAKQQEKEILLQAKEKSLKVIDEAKSDERERRKELLQTQKRLEQRESSFDKKLLSLEDRKIDLENKQSEAIKIKEDLQNIKEQGLEKLQKIARMSKEEAAQSLIKNIEQEVSDDLTARIRKLERESQDVYEEKAKHLMATAMDRCAMSLSVETTTTSVEIPSDDMKGRIIGKEGRNIKAIEQATGTEIVVDDTPGVIFVSGFSLLRRHVARLALEKLISDGRIHPGRVEEAVEDAKKEIAKDIRRAGEDAAHEIGVVGLDPKLIQILGRLKYRTSYGHNVLQHSKEVAILAGLMASELGVDPVVTKKAGLLHDIGKALDHEIKGGHPKIGYDIMKKFGLPEEVAYVSIGHHEDKPTSVIALVVKAADAISGSRPGARKDTYEQYLQRLDELEDVASSFDGVDKVYAIYAGREVRVFVKPNQVDDWAAKKLAKDISAKIEHELKYPGEIKVNVIRENRIIEYAR